MSVELALINLFDMDFHDSNCFTLLIILRGQYNIFNCHNLTSFVNSLRTLAFKYPNNNLSMDGDAFLM